MSSKHTPGPWTIEQQDGTVIVPNDHRRNPIAEILCTGRADSANARLIAAAPDLLAACELLLASRTADPPDSWPAITAAQVAIAKAKGET